MKRIVGYFIIIVFTAGVIITTYFNFQIDRAIEIASVFLIISMILLFELKNLDSKTMTVIATLAALGGVFRVPFAIVPGLQPTTFIAAVSGYTFGPVSGFMVGAMSAFISNFFLGQGPWTLWQMMGWGLCGFFFGIIRRMTRKENIVLFAVMCGLWGYIFGIIVDMWFVLGYLRPINIKNVLAGVASSFYFDTIHSIGNLVFAFIFGKRFIKTLNRYKMRYSVEYLD